MYGRPGSCYIDIPGDFVNLQVNKSSVKCVKITFIIFQVAEQKKIHL